MVPSSARMTSEEPAFAQEIAHCLLIGLSRFLVKAHAESRTYPFTVIVGASAAGEQLAATSRATNATRNVGNANFISGTSSSIIDMWTATVIQTALNVCSIFALLMFCPLGF